MLLLHAGLFDGRLCLWGEAPSDAAAPAVRRGRKPRSPAPRPYPYDAGAERLEAALADVVPQADRAPAADAPPFLWAPDAGGQAVPSGPLIAEVPAVAVAPTLQPWAVAVRPLTPSGAVALLASCLDRDTLAPGVLIAPTLAYWAQALRFACALTAREQFVPHVRAEGRSFVAGWRPVLAGAEAERAARLARAMPPACRALGPAADAAPDRPADAVLADFLAAAVDVLVRAADSAALVRTPPKGRRAKPEFASLHEQWLYALTAPDGTLTGPAAELARLAEQVAAWQRPALGAAAAPFRLCFRLEEPAADLEPVAADGAWQVRYLLQARDDPSLLIPAADAWAPAGRVAAVFRRRAFQPREHLLTALGQAAALAPPIEASLRSARPAGYTADAAGAYEFLTRSAWLLEQAGFGVQLPSWWTPRGARLRLGVRASVQTPAMRVESGKLSLARIVQVDWRAALGDQVLSAKELEALARLKQPLVRVRGQWVEIRPEDVQTVLDLLKKKAARVTAREAVQLALGAAEGPGGAAVDAVEAEGWMADLLGRLQGNGAFADLEPPAGLRAALRPYQLRGYSWLAFLQQWGLGACLADDMGLGKTVQTLALLQRNREQGEDRPALLVCPTSVLGNWTREAERFTPGLSFLLHHGPQRPTGVAFARQAAKHAVVLTSYALLHRDAEALKKVPWAAVVLDEAQNVKNPHAKQSQAARALPADFRVALTGTPVENHVGDLWSLLEFLNPGFLGGQADFRRRFLVPIQARRDADAAGRLKRLTGPFLLRRLKTDKTVIADLPDKVEMKVFCTLTKEQATLYAAVVEEATKTIEDSEGIERRGNILATLTRLKQVCNHPAHFLGDRSALAGRSGKLARLTELLDEALDAGDRALLFTQFTEMGELLKRHLQETFGREVLFLHGGVTRKERDRLVKRFQEEGDGPRLFVLSLKAGGTGLNLTAARHVIHFDRWWNPAVENQATDRAFRIGQTKNVLVHKFVCSGTLEEKIDELIESKQETAARVVGGGEGWLTELSNEKLRDLFALRREALGD